MESIRIPPGYFYCKDDDKFYSLQEMLSAHKKFQLTIDLYPHQKEGINWMHDLETTTKVGAILADDMGLGKTIQILGCICYDEMAPRGPTLIITPKSIVNQWVSEATNKTDIPASLIYLYYGGKNTISVPKGSLIVVTTYGTALRDAMKENSPLRRINWRRIVLDEAHIIRNRKTKSFNAIMSFKKTFGWCVTGTPINNHIKDLYSLIDFCGMPTPLTQMGINATGKLKYSWIESYQRRDQYQLNIWRKKYICRRTKNILNLPQLREHNIELKFNEEEKKEYLAVIAEAESAFNNWLTSENRTLEEYSQILVKILRLRQCCDHKGLKYMNCTGDNECVLCHSDISDYKNNNVSCEIHPICSQCLPKKVQKCYLCDVDILKDDNLTSTKVDAFFEMLPKLEGKGVVYSQWIGMLDVFEHRCAKEGIKIVRLDGKMDQVDRENSIKLFNEDPEVKLFLVSLKAGGVGLNLTAARWGVLFDPWWNPFVEDQACDRIYRIGQNKEVDIYRFVIKNSIETWLDILKKKKRQISTIIVGDQAFATVGTNGVKKEELDSLFTFLRSHAKDM